MATDYILNKFSTHLFWDVDRSQMTFENSQSFMVGRVLQYGEMSDWILLNELLGIEKIGALAKELRTLDKVSLNYISILSGIPIEEFRCYKLSQSNPNFWEY